MRAEVPGQRRKDRGGDGRTGAATEESPAVMTERPRREKWRKTATTKGRTAMTARPAGDGREVKEGGMEEDGNDKRTDGDRRKTERRRQKGRDG